MQLYLSTTSPFGRICLICALLLRHTDIRLHFVNPWENPAELAAKNPFGQIPVLQTDEHTVIYNTHLICQYLRNDTPSAEDLAISSYATSLLDNTIQALKLVRFKAENSDNHPLVERCFSAVKHALPQAPAFHATSNEWPHIMLGTTLLTLKLRYPDVFIQYARPDTVQAVVQFEQRDFIRQTDPTALEQKPATVGDVL